MLEFRSDVIKDISSAKMYCLIAAVEILIKHNLFAFGPILFLTRRQGCFMFFLELLMEQKAWLILTIWQFDNLPSLAKWSRVRLPTKWLWIRILLLSLKLQISCLFSSKGFLDIQATIEYRLILKRERDMIITCSHH